MFPRLLLAQQIDPDLRGVWKLNVEKSDFGGGPKPKMGQVNWTEHGTAWGRITLARPRSEDLIATRAVSTNMEEVSGGRSGKTRFSHFLTGKLALSLPRLRLRAGMKPLSSIAQQQRPAALRPSIFRFRGMRFRPTA